MNIVSILIGLVAFVMVLVGLLINLLNWITLPLALIGVVIGLFSSHHTGRNLNLLVVIIAAVRLWIGGGII